MKDYHWESAVVYCDRDDDLQTVRQLVQKRDPVNIALNTEDGSTEGGFVLKDAPKARSYLQQADRRVLPPNIAIFCTTPMMVDGQLRDAHVFNAIAFGFDHEDQPDAQYFCNLNSTKIATEKHHAYKNHVRRIVRKILACAKHEKMQRVMLAMIGCGAFAGDNAELAAQTLMGAVGAELRAATDLLPLELGMLGGIDVEIFPNAKATLRSALEKACSKTLHRVMDSTKAHYIPNCLADCEEEVHGKTMKTMYVNAWDPHSAVGNGNARDNSLDGFFGRASALGPLCHPYANKHLRPVHRYVRVGDTADK